jgi:hypothetical protein
LAAIDDDATSFRERADALNLAGLTGERGGIWRSSDVAKRARRLGIEFAGKPRDVPADYGRADAAILNLWQREYTRSPSEAARRLDEQGIVPPRTRK